MARDESASERLMPLQLPLSQFGSRLYRPTCNCQRIKLRKVKIACGDHAFCQSMKSKIWFKFNATHHIIRQGTPHTPFSGFCCQIECLISGFPTLHNGAGDDSLYNVQHRIEVRQYVLRIDGYAYDIHVHYVKPPKPVGNDFCYFTRQLTPIMICLTASPNHSPSSTLCKWTESTCLAKCRAAIIQACQG